MSGQPATEVRRARYAVATVFAAHGAATGSFLTRVPWVQDNLALDEGRLGLALLMPALGAIGSMPFVGRLIHRYGSRAVARATMPLWCAAIVLPPLAPNLVILCFALVAYGVAAGTSDIAMNAQGVSVEAGLGRPVMSGLHGMWSVGGLLGAGGGALATRAGLGAPTHLAIAAAVLVTVAVVATSAMLHTEPDPELESPALFALPGREVLLIGAVGFCAVFAEGSAGEWCAVYLRTVTSSSDATAAMGYAAFAFTMAAGRLGGDAVIARVGTVRSVRVSGVIAFIGGVLVVVARTPALAIAGFALIGLGIATVVPLAFAAAGRAGPHPGQAIAGVATIAYGAGLAAPAAVGGIADVTSLPFSFALVTALIALVVAGARALDPPVAAPAGTPAAAVAR